MKTKTKNSFYINGLATKQNDETNNKTKLSNFKMEELK